MDSNRNTGFGSFAKAAVALAACAALAVPAPAQAGGRHDRHDRHHHQSHGRSNSNVVPFLVGGAIVAGVLAAQPRTVVVSSRPTHWVGPRVVYAPAPVYSYPPPVVYAPAPVYAAPPLGALVDVLPPDAREVSVDGFEYFHWRGRYFQRDPFGGFRVVPDPLG